MAPNDDLYGTWQRIVDATCEKANAATTDMEATDILIAQHEAIVTAYRTCAENLVEICNLANYVLVFAAECGCSIEGLDNDDARQRVQRVAQQAALIFDATE